MGFSTTSYAKVEIGDVVSVLHVRASEDAISDVLAAISKVINLRYRTSVRLERMISGDYEGSVESVIARLLKDYNFVIGHTGEVIEVSVYGMGLGDSSTPNSPMSPTVVPAPPAPPAAPQQHPAAVSQPNPQRDIRYEHFRVAPPAIALQDR